MNKLLNESLDFVNKQNRSAYNLYVCFYIYLYVISSFWNKTTLLKQKIRINRQQ